jgi:hypothetical protein
VQVRAWHSYGAYDPNGAVVIKNARSAGISNVGVYLFPCAGQSASSQVHEMVAALQKDGISTTGLPVWMDIGA